MNEIATRLASGRREVGILMLTALGDAVHVLPVLRAMRRSRPDWRLTWIIQPIPHRLVAPDHPADDYVIFDRRRGPRAWTAYAEARRAMAGRRFDLLVCLQVYLKAGLLAAVLPADVKLGFDRRRARDANWLFTNARIPARGHAHVQDQYFEFLRYLGIDPEPVVWGLEPTEEERAEQSAFRERTGGAPLCGFVVATSRPEKNWAPERYARTIDAVRSDLGMTPVLIGGPSAIEREAAERIAAAGAGEPVDMLGDDVRRLVWLSQACDVVVSPDTGPLHVARAVGTPVVGLYGFTNPLRYGPYHAFGDLVVDGYARVSGEDYPLSAQHRRDGMDRVDPDAVLAAIERARARYGAGRPVAPTDADEA
ncbi:MAG TPA: glycosyltransferase family 9 protein [Longimicrobiales bacterium]|nr:glycosyltransferase family 9 protein [Longimicrobiales bacterium]